MSLMSTYGTDLQTGKETQWEWIDESGTKKQEISLPQSCGPPFLVSTLSGSSQQ